MGKTVLVVDDDPEFMGMLEDVLQLRGYSAVPCPEPKLACQKAKQLHPSAIILDLLMPGFNGWQVIEQFEADPATASIPLIVCTGDPHEAFLHRPRLRPWCREILAKPFELDDLFSSLAKVMAGQR